MTKIRGLVANTIIVDDDIDMDEETFKKISQNFAKVNCSLSTKASKDLKKEIEDELEQKDPDVETAKAILERRDCSDSREDSTGTG